MGDNDPAQVKNIITGLVTSNPLRCTIRQLAKDFYEFVGYNIPFRQLGFIDVEEYLRSIPDTVKVYGSGPSAEVQGVIKPNSAHISEMVTKQKKNSVPKHLRRHIKQSPRRPPPRPFTRYGASACYFVPAGAHSSPQPPPHHYHSAPRPQHHPPPLRSQHCPTPPQTRYVSPPPPARRNSTPSPARHNPTPPSQSPSPPAPPQNRSPRPAAPYLAPAGSEHRNVKPPDRNDKPPSREESPEPESEDSDWESGPEPELDPEPEPKRPESTEKDVDTLEMTNGDATPPVYENTRIPVSVQNNLRELILQFPEGISSTKLPTEYRRMFKKNLSYDRFNYRSILDMCANLPDIFNYLQTPSGFMLFYKNKPIPPTNQNEEVVIEPEEEEVATRSVLQDLPKIDWEVTSPLVPQDILPLSDRIPRVFPYEHFKENAFVEVMIGEIYDMSKFYVYLALGPLKRLMNEIQEFFKLNRNKYLIPELLLSEGLYCVCLYAGEFHRTVIVNLLPGLPGFVRVLFVDYGSVGNVRSKEIWFLPKKFATVPYQATRARLSNIVPNNKDSIWTIQAVNRFRELVITPLVAEIIKVNEEDFSVELYLADVKDEENIFYINDVLVEEGHALFADQLRQPIVEDPNCKPLVEYIHLYPEFSEIESGRAPTAEEMNFFVQNNIPLVHYMPQYFDFYFPENPHYQAERHDSNKKIYKQLQLIDRPDEPDGLDLAFFSFDLVDDMREMARQNEVSSSNPVVAVKTDGENSADSVREYSCNKKRISELIRSADSNKLEVSDLPSTSSQSSLDLPSPDVAPMNNLTSNLPQLSLSDSSDSVPKTKLNNSFSSTNPFLNCDTNPFRLSSTNPFLSDLGDTNPSDLFKEFSKDLEEKLPQRIVNNLNPSPPCACRVKQVNVEREEAGACDIKQKEDGHNRRVRTPPGFVSNNPPPPYMPNPNMPWPPMGPQFFNPYYQRFPNNNMMYNQMGPPGLMPPNMPPNYGMVPNYVMPPVPPPYVMDMQFMQQAFAQQQNFGPRPFPPPPPPQNRSQQWRLSNHKSGK